MFETFISSVSNLTDKILRAVLGTVTIVLVTFSSFTGKTASLPNQTPTLDQKSLQELKILAESNLNFSGKINLNLPTTLSETLLVKKDATFEASLIAETIGVTGFSDDFIQHPLVQNITA